MGTGGRAMEGQKGSLLSDNSLDVVCQCIRVVMHVCCLFMRDAVFGYTLEKVTTLCWL